jgi:hypothetical protein
MKKFCSFLFASLLFGAVCGQVPQGFNYQAVAKNSTGSPIANTALQVKASILSDTLTPVIVWEELHSKVTTNPSGVFNLVIGSGTKQSGSAAAFSSINWAVSVLYLKIQIYYQGAWKYMGTTRLWSTPYSMVSDKAKSVDGVSKFSITSTDDLGTNALFEVKRKDGQTVFAVYPDAVNIYVPRTVKGAKGGFAVGGFESGKLTPQDYFRVTPDSVRIYIDPSPAAKGAKGGFAVGGYGDGKGINNMYFNLTGASSVNTVVSSPQVLWYPNKNAFLAGNVHIGAVDSVGSYSTALGYQSVAMGDYSQAFGYRAKALGDYSTSIGKNSIAGSKLPVAKNAFALGDAAQATGPESYAFGSGAIASGIRAFAFGSVGLNDSQVPQTGMPTRATGNYSVALGMGSYAYNTGAMAIGVGAVAGGIASSVFGYYGTASSSFSTAIGYKTTASGAYSLAAGSNSVAAGDNSFAIGTNGLNTDGTVNTARPTKTVLSYSIAVGMGAQANLKGDMALGVNTTSQGGYSTAMGYGALASGLNSISLGYNTQATAQNSAAFGSSSQATSTNALAMGNGSVAAGTNSTAMGYQTQANGELSIAIGSFYSHSFAALPYFSGAKGDPVEGDSKGDFIIRLPTITPLFKTINFSRANIANGKYSIAIGNGNLANNGGMALGSNNDATAFGAVAVGVSNKAVNTNTYAAGYNNLATGYYATAFGNNTYSKAFGSFVIGQFNEIAGDSTKWISTDPVFVVGNGLSTTDRSNAITIYKNGRSIFLGEHANVSLNDKVTRFMRIFPIGYTTTTSVYGVKSYVNRSDTNVDYYFSGYFYNTGTAGTYKGLYADLINAYDINVTNINGVAADVAEYIYDTNSNSEPGDVVIADPLNKISIIKSAKPYQSSVLGIISTKPMMTLGNELVMDESTHDPLVNAKPSARLALTGRVVAKVTGENGPIIPGDLLTTSSTPGHAMKWSLLDVTKAKDFEEMKTILAENERRRNAVIGKAIESFSGSGTGNIMVFISLQ